MRYHALRSPALQDIMTYLKARVAARAAALDSRAAAAAAASASETSAPAATASVAAAPVAEAPAEAAAAAVVGGAAAPALAGGKVNLFFSEDEFNQGAPPCLCSCVCKCLGMHRSGECGAALPVCSTGQRWRFNCPTWPNLVLPCSCRSAGCQPGEAGGCDGHCDLVQALQALPAQL